jgi:hypothetical protein
MLIPPLTLSARTLRTELMLRLTGEVLDSVVGYAPTNTHAEVNEVEVNVMTEGNTANDDPSPLRLLLSYLDGFDEAWLAVLRNQVWDSEESVGRDMDELEPDPRSNSNSVSMDLDQDNDANMSMNVDFNTDSVQKTSKADQVAVGLQPNSTSIPQPSLPASISQTNRTRLRSLLITGTQKLEDWLPRIVYAVSDSGIDSDFDTEATHNREQTHLLALRREVEETMDSVNERSSFNDIFWRTLTEMGELS